MARRGVRVAVLCEDDEHQRFALHALKELGFGAHELRFFICPAGRGSAEQWVRRQYPDQVQALRRRAAHQSVGLLVVVDADRLSVTQRAGQLAAALRERQFDPRGAGERIVHWAPKRHVETWVWFCVHTEANESDDYTSRAARLDFRAAANKFVALYRGRRPEDLLPSIATAFVEWQRIDQ